MKKTIKKISLALFLVAAIVVGFTNSNNNVYAATVGNTLSSAEAGWKRFDNTDSRLYYDSTEWKHQNDLKSGFAYNNTWSVMEKQNQSVKIKFKGTKLRIIACMENKSNCYGCPNVKITIDGVDYSFSTKGTLTRQALVYSNENLGSSIEEEHTAIITNMSDGSLWFDAIDIDEDGKLLNANPNAPIGKKLENPEDGWKRFDDTDPRLCYDFTEWNHENDLPSGFAYNNTWSVMNKQNHSVKIKFKGTKLRIIACMENKSNCYGCDNVKITIDGVDYSFSTKGTLTRQALVYSNENLGNSEEEHTAIITNMSDGFLWFDAIDIDEDGELLDANTVISLDKNELTMNVGETQNVVATVSPKDAADKSVTWKSSDESICIVDENGEITAVSPGEAVVTATANDGSGMSASCNVTVVDGRRGVLTINMNNAKQYTYDMSMAEINEFTNWYNNISKDQGDAYYIIDSNPQSGAYKSDSHYFNYNNISDFIINTY